MNRVERERKWLLKRLPDIASIDGERTSIHQFYGADGYRYRRTVPLTCDGKSVYEKLKKVVITPGVNHELNVETITAQEFATCNAVSRIFKIRYTLRMNGYVFEIDKFNNMDLVVMEVENVDLDEKIIFPKDIQDNILMEVTGNSAFNNSNLADPY